MPPPPGLMGPPPGLGGGMLSGPGSFVPASSQGEFTLPGLGLPGLGLAPTPAALLQQGQVKYEENASGGQEEEARQE